MNAEAKEFAPRLIYMTAKDKPEASKIGEALVRENLVACVNILPGMESIYHWEGKLCKESEVVLLAKTDAHSVEKIIKRVTELHSYSVPCVVAIPIVDGNPKFIKWIEDEMKKAPK